MERTILKMNYIIKYDRLYDQINIHVIFFQEIKEIWWLLFTDYRLIKYF